MHDAGNYANLIYTASNVDLHTDGTAAVIIPASYGGSYFLTVHHRNSIETVSAAPVSFSGNTIAYTFDNGSNAYGGNLMYEPDGKWVIYGGDTNQDGLVDATDMVLIDNAASSFQTGYIDIDVNGDGLIDSSDMVLLDNNASQFIARITP